MEATVNEIKFTDKDIVDVEDCVYAGEFNPHNIHPFLFHDHGYVLCVVFASHLQDALDKAVDEDKLDRFQVDAKEVEAMTDAEAEELSFLGNAGEPFDIENLGFIELSPPKRSWVAEWAASNPQPQPA